jgi:predicted Zn-dependent peptidase
MSDLDAASMDDVRQWFTDKYGPNNATLVMAGDVSAAEAKVLAEKYFGSIKRGPVNTPAAADVPTLAQDVRKVMKDQVAATSVTRYWPGPGITDADLTALNVGAAILGGLASSRLDEVLVRDEQLAVGVSANSSNFQRVGLLSVSATAKPGVDLAVLEKRLDELVTKFVTEGPTEDEVRRAVTSSLARTVRGLEQVRRIWRQGRYSGQRGSAGGRCLVLRNPARTTGQSYPGRCQGRYGTMDDTAGLYSGSRTR